MSIPLDRENQTVILFTLNFIHSSRLTRSILSSEDFGSNFVTHIAKLPIQVILTLSWWWQISHSRGLIHWWNVHRKNVIVMPGITWEYKD